MMIAGLGVIPSLFALLLIALFLAANLPRSGAVVRRLVDWIGGPPDDRWGGLVTAGLTVLFITAPPSVPEEQVRLEGGRQEQAFVLQEVNDFVPLFASATRTVEMVPKDSILERRICRQAELAWFQRGFWFLLYDRPDAPQVACEKA